jgi:organic radical activating enzyme
MEMRLIDLSKTLSIQPTYQCTAECKDCGAKSGPNVKTKISLGTIKSAIDQAKELNFANVVFTGGEPTLMWNDLLEAIAYCKSKGLLTRVVTNAYWATSASVAESKMKIFREFGLDEINFSTGDEHAKFVPLERVLNASIAAVNFEYSAFIMVELRKNNKINKDFILSHPVYTSLPNEVKSKIDFTESPWMPLNPDRLNNYPNDVAINNNNLSGRRGCDSIFTTYLLQADGKIGSCCGIAIQEIPELNVSDISDKDFLKTAVEASKKDILKLLIRYKGPERILSWAASKNSEIQWEDQYAHNCQACLRMYSDERVKQIVKSHYKELLHDLSADIYINETLIPKKLQENYNSLQNKVDQILKKSEIVPLDKSIDF